MEVSDVRAYYVLANSPDVKAVDGVSFKIREGEVLGIAGESGCGKSTLAAVMSLTARPPLTIKSGVMKIGGETIQLAEQKEAPSDWHGRMVALLPQRAMNSLNPTAKVRDFVYDVIHAHDRTISRQEAVERTRQRLEQVSLPARVLDSYPHQLSGGMRQRVVAVISTMLDPKVLIADEPTSALDVSSQKQLVELLKLFLENEFITRIAFITHDLPMLSNIADRIAVMYAGRVVEIGTTQQIIDEPRHPYTYLLTSSTLDPDPAVRGRRLEGIQGAPPDLRYPPSGCRFHPRCPFAMDICSKEEPPIVGTEDYFAACWWVAEKSKGESIKGAVR